MCGIVGIYNPDRNINSNDLDILKTMTDSISYRGPDDHGFYTDRGLGFGFRRLSIIDLETGNQPISNEDESMIMVCNGEIFNFKELRRDLEIKGHVFKTKSDVEVIIHLYEDYGTNLLNMLNGQFALAIYDKTMNSLFLARDHVGIVPLFYTQKDDTFIFASEIKAIIKHPTVKREVDITGLDQIISFPGMVSPWTMFKDIKSFKPGHYIMVKENKLKIKEYWDLNYPLEKNISADLPVEHYVEKLGELLENSVKYRLHADVPVGFYLSGGLDSSLMAALIHKIDAERSRHSFSIGFDQPDIDERYYQNMISKMVGSIHHETVFDWKQISNRLSAAILHSEAPLKESYNTCSLALSEFVRKSDVKVILTGEGADEMFGGYVGYRFDQHRNEESFDLESMMEQEMRVTLWGDSDFFYEKNYFQFREIKTALYSESLIESLDEFECYNKELIRKDSIFGKHPIHKRSYVDFKLRLSDHLLADHGDRVACANSIEARYPFLDINLLEFAKTIPPNLMVHNKVEKYILRQVAKPYLPDKVINREKFGFVAPGTPSLIRQNLDWVNDILSYDMIKKQGYFNPDTVERLKETYSSDGFKLNPTFDNDLLMIVLTFGIFKDLFNMPDY
ncbi:MAG: asparagine synthase (glutamine-hydrolyzing) [Colwellia sp.]|nr:asparagine synthase (glutamine-hydrolyzing) [Colwellia sp.]